MDVSVTILRWLNDLKNVWHSFYQFSFGFTYTFFLENCVNASKYLQKSFSQKKTDIINKAIFNTVSRKFVSLSHKRALENRLVICQDVARQICTLLCVRGYRS